MAAGSMTREAALLLFSSVRANVSTIYRISFARTQGRIETEKRRAIGADNFADIAHFEVDVWVILRRLIADALELVATNADHWRPDFVMKLRITFHKLAPVPSRQVFTMLARETEPWVQFG